MVMIMVHKKDDSNDAQDEEETVHMEDVSADDDERGAHKVQYPSISKRKPKSKKCRGSEQEETELSLSLPSILSIQ
mgnify:CR=1 FL=1